MELTEVLREIRPCDTDNHPYIFISYSGEDKELVWRDVLEFQRRGYNIWIDEKNLDKTQDSWRYNALPAIEDMDCELVVFYVSRHSLISEGCYLELGKTIEAQTQAIHFGPVKFIAVDVEEIGNIMEFSKTVYNELRSSDLPKEQKQQRAIILDKFKKDFFNSNNEKVRIHPKNEVNRKMDYYEEILASFPDSTRIFPEYSEEEVSAEEEAPVEITASNKAEATKKAVVTAKEEVTTGDVVSAEKETAEEMVVPAEKETAEEVTTPAGEKSTKERPDNITHEEIISQAMRILNQHQKKWYSIRFMKVGELSDTQISNALEMFNVDAGAETLIGLCEVVKNWKIGFLITTEKLYVKMAENVRYSLDLWKISKVIYPGKYVFEGELIFEDDSRRQIEFSLFNDDIFSFLAIVTEIKEGIRQIGIHDSYHITEEMIKNAVSNMNATSSCSFEYLARLKEKQIRNATKTYARLDSADQIICMWDTSTLKNGKKGFLVTRDRLYCSDSYDYIELDNLKEAVLDGSHIIITYNDGYRKVVRFHAHITEAYTFLKELVMPESV